MRKATTLFIAAAFTASLAMSQTVKTVTFDFQKPATISPTGYAPEVPENPDDRSSMYEVNINGVGFTADGVTITAVNGQHNEGDIPKNLYTWRRGYDDNYDKRPTDSNKEGTYYLNLRMSDTEDGIAADPSQKHFLTVTVPDGAVLKEVVIHGLSAANAAQYLLLADPESGTYTPNNSTRLNTFTPAEGKNLSEVSFTLPRKRPDGVNLSGYLVANISVTYQIEENPTPYVYKTVKYDFQKPETITPAGYAPVVPENPDDRSSMYEVNINGVGFIADGVTVTALNGQHNEGDTPKNLYTWRRGYDDNYDKRPTDSNKEGTYYLNLRMSDTEDGIAADPSQKHFLTVTAPEGGIIKEVVIHGLSAANAAQYLLLADPESGTFTPDNSTRLNTFTPAEGKNLSEVSFTLPRKRPDGVNLSGYLVANISVTVAVPEATEPEPEPEPEGLQMPYSRVFKNLDDMTVIDANNDGYTWEYNLSTARCTAPIGDSNPNTEGDDWLITPALAMYANKYYKVYTPLVASYGTPGKVEVKLGTDKTPESMSLSVAEPFEFDGRCDHISYVKVPTTGTYYLGMHSVTPRGGALYVKLSSIDIYEPMETTSPGAVTNLKVIPHSDGVKPYKVTLTFNAPSVDLDGNPLTENLEKVVIGVGTYAGNALASAAKTFTDVKPGEELTYTYSQNGTGYKTFGIVAYNASGIGMETYTPSTYVGVNKPAQPTDLTITETGTPGQVVLSWKAPETDQDGNPINASLIKYHLTDGVSFESIVRNFEGTSYTYNTGLTDRQDFFKFSIVAETAGGSAFSVTSPQVAVGKAAAAPLTESFDRATVMPILFENADGVAKIFHDYDMSGTHRPYGVEGDGYYVALYGYTPQAHPSLLTGKISLQGLTAPVVTFNVFSPVDANENRIFNNNKVVVKVLNNQRTYVDLATIKLGDLPSAGWNRVVYPLADFAGQDIQLFFEGALVDFPTADTGSFTFIDRMQVREMPAAKDLIAVNLITPVVAEQGEPFEIVAYVENDSNSPVENAEVEFYRNKELIKTVELSTLAAGQIEPVLLNQTLGAIHDAEVSYYATIVADSDTRTDNNTTEEKEVDYKTTIHPAPESLTGTKESGTIKLNWEAPLLAGGTASEYTESFEINDILAVDNFKDWVFYDLDKGTLDLPTGMTIEGVEIGKTQYAWMIADESIFKATGMAHTGTHFLTGFFNYDGRSNNDLAVSPELSGHAQTISFYAISFASKYPETLDVFYSKTNRDVMSFIPLKRIEYVGSDWTEYTFDLPEGARFFAIRHASADAWIVGVDDVTFIPMEPGKDVEILGYNVYRNGEKINSEPVKETTFSDTGMEEGKSSYRVSTVYDKGESLACAPIEIEYSGVNSVFSGSNSVEGGVGYIEVSLSTEAGINVYSTTGMRVVHSDCAAGKSRIELPAGVYIVSLNGVSTKVIVR